MIFLNAISEKYRCRHKKIPLSDQPIKGEFLLKLGRNTGVEPVHDRFTAGCVHRFTNCATLEYYIVRQLVSQKKNLLLSLCVPIRHY